jgi:hypothetical protein
MTMPGGPRNHTKGHADFSTGKGSGRTTDCSADSANQSSCFLGSISRGDSPGMTVGALDVHCLAPEKGDGHTKSANTMEGIR